MKYIILIASLFWVTINYAQHPQDNHQKIMNKISKETPQDTISIAVLLYNNVVLQDFAGPMEVFGKAKKLTKGKYKIFTVGLTSGEIHSENNLLQIKPDYTVDHFPKADYVLIPGGSMPIIEELMKNEKLSSYIKEWYASSSTKVVSVCTAAYLLANTGILDGKSATTHFFVADDFEEQFPKVKLIRDVRFVDEGTLITSSGVTSGIDAALYIVEKHSGKKIQEMISRALQYNYGENEKWPVAPHGMRYRSKRNN
ncbi:DJ-1/PfpI family protein [Zhouia sp. PK063]|uniref:DJ-1/PfpI family protein n=1 Tax=Zhouia sp. PK063 TaxID=3373602 RepID=UPI0037A2B33C